MAKVKLDRSRPFATVHGIDAAHQYEQDGMCFDHAGNQCSDRGRVAPETPEEKIARLELENARLKEAKPAAAGPTIAGVKEMRAEYKRRTGKGFPVGTKKTDMARMLEELPPE